MRPSRIGWILALVFLPVVAACQPVWNQREFVIGTFMDPPFNLKDRNTARDSIRFARAAAAGFNVLTGTQEGGDIDRSFEGMVYALRLAHRAGIKYMLTDDRYFQASEHDFSLGAACALVDQYRSLPARLRKTIYALNLCDEPSYNRVHFERIKAWKSFFDTAWAEVPMYINLAPSYAANSNWGGFTRGTMDGNLRDDQRGEYEDYVALYADSLHLPIVSFDNYPFFKDGRVRKDYFYNLEIVRRKAGVRPFWTYPMTTGHLEYADPSQEQLYFMYFSPLAYGAKGLVVFTYWRLLLPRFRSALVERSGARTSRYWVVKRLNFYVRSVVAPVVMNYKNIQVYHASDMPGAQVLLSRGNEPNEGLPVVSSADPRLLVGSFVRSDTVCLLVVNKSLQPASNLSVSITGTYKSARSLPRIGQSYSQKDLAGSRLALRVTSDKSISSFTLSGIGGGEGRLVRLVRR